MDPSSTPVAYRFIDGHQRHQHDKSFSNSHTLDELRQLTTIGADEADKVWATARVQKFIVDQRKKFMSRRRAQKKRMPDDTYSRK